MKTSSCFLLDDARLQKQANHFDIAQQESDMATIQPKGEKLRQAVKWISEKRKEDEKKPFTVLVQEASSWFNLSPKEEEFLNAFYKEAE